MLKFFDGMHIPYFLTIIILLLLIWLYTNKSGIKTIVWTDALQSFFLITVIIVSIITIKNSLNLSLGGMASALLYTTLYAKLFVTGILIRAQISSSSSCRDC